MELSERKNAFLKLGKVFRNIAENQQDTTLKNASILHRRMQESVYENPWFTPKNVCYAIQSLGNVLTEEHLEQWLKPYSFVAQNAPKTIGVVMAGNIPLVGFHDFLCVLIGGNKLLAKTASTDCRLMATVCDLLVEIEPNFSEFISFSEGLMKNCDAYIATGSDNSARYFEQYFGEFPHIIRHHRNAVAVLHGKETKEQLADLAEDVFCYYGLGCRNVSKLFVPKGFDFTNILQQWESWANLHENLKYFHNYTYHKTIYLVNNEPHFDNGFLLLKSDESFSSPIAVLFYEEYENLLSVERQLAQNEHRLQCVVSDCKEIENAIPFGKAQQPNLWDYADGVDTMRFLLDL